MSTHLVIIHALSPMHCGTGQAISGIDLPIAREKPTGTPLVPGSTQKGVLRAHPGGYALDAQRKPRPTRLHLSAFGPETENAAEHAGAVQFGDARLVFLPVRSVRGTFAWVTSPHLLRRLGRDLKECGLNWKLPPAPATDRDALVASERLVVKIGQTERVVYEDFDFAALRSKELESFARDFAVRLYGPEAQDELDHFLDRVCVVGDDVMRVLARVGMEITARNRIGNETRTVEKGALWTEESLPAESVLTGLVMVTPLRGEDPATLVGHVRELCRGVLQFGGKSTIGRGLCRMEVV